MNEVEKLYENAGIEPEPSCDNCNKLDEFWNNGSYNCTCKDDKSSYECDKASFIYPPFTAEKQIELIKWLIVHSPYTCLEDEIITSAFEDSLANIINTMWQDLNKEERKQIKEILEHADGECRWFKKEIVIDDELDDIVYMTHVIKHEIIHAFLAESGLKKYKEDEDIVDWIAWNIDKINKVFNEVLDVKP